MMYAPSSFSSQTLARPTYGSVFGFFLTWRPLHLPSEGAFSSSLLSALQPTVGMSQSQPEPTVGPLRIDRSPFRAPAESAPSLLPLPSSSPSLSLSLSEPTHSSPCCQFRFWGEGWGIPDSRPYTLERAAGLRPLVDSSVIALLHCDRTCLVLLGMNLYLIHCILHVTSPQLRHVS